MKTALFRFLQRMPEIIVVALIASLAVSASAQQAGQDETTQLLLRRIDQLEAKVKQLEEKQATPAPAPPSEPAASQPEVNAVNELMKLNLLGDVGYKVR